MYAIRRYVRSAHPHIEHGLLCTEALVRLWLGNREAEVIGQPQFRMFRVVPDFGLVYPNGQAMLVECQTVHRVYATVRKIHLYDRHIAAIEEGIRRKPFVLFVLDAPPQTVANLVQRAPSAHYFVDVQTFLRVPYGRQLDEPIYIWGTDGASYPLRG